MDPNWEEMFEEDNKDDEEMLKNNSQFLETTMAAVSSFRERDIRTSTSRRSIMGRRYKERNREVQHTQLMNDYFVQNPVYSDDNFRRRFWMRQHVFLRLLQQVQKHNPYFQQRPDCTRRQGFSSHQKVTVALRMLAHAGSADSLDENLRIGESTSIETLRQFCSTIVDIYQAEYLRSPTPADLQVLLEKSERWGFPGMIGSLDCMHWQWKNCPTEWQGAFIGRSRNPTIILEAVASHDTWIWHAFFGMPGSRNDLATLGCSPLFDRLTLGEVPNIQYKVNGREHHMPYYLVDGIYPKWGTFVPSIKRPHTPQEQLFSRMQESYRKDVERAFGILQARFAIVKHPGRGWNRTELRNIMMTCIILHNMIVEDERDGYIDGHSDDDEPDGNRSRRARALNYDGAVVDPNPRSGDINLDMYMVRYRSIRSQPVNNRLQTDLIQHLWARHGEGN